MVQTAGPHPSQMTNRWTCPSLAEPVQGRLQHCVARCEVCGSHSGLAEYSSLLGCCDVSKDRSDSEYLNLKMKPLRSFETSSSCPSHHQIKINFNIILPPTPVFQMASFRQISPAKLCTKLSYPPACQRHRTSHSCLFHHRNNNTWWGLQSLKLLPTMQSPSVPCHLVSLRPQV